MQPATKLLSDEERWLALFLRNACRPNWSLKNVALSWPSMFTIEKQLRLNQDPSEEAELKRQVEHQALMIKIGMRLGLGARELML